MVDNSHEIKLSDLDVDDKKHLNQKSFWQKITHFAKKAGREVLEKALILYYLYQSDQVPKKYKAMIVAVLGYFITTLDAVPDFMPLVGFADDLGLLVALVGFLASWISPDIEDKVEQKLQKIFKKDDSSATHDAP